MQELNAVHTILEAKYLELDAARPIYISTSALALATYEEIDPKKKAPSLVKFECLLQLKQQARAFCRRRRILSEDASEQQGNLFDIQLQARYPATRKIDGEDEDVYVLRDHLTLEERRENSRRLRQEGLAKMAHADLLDAETEFKISTGELKEEEPVPTA